MATIVRPRRARRWASASVAFAFLRLARVEPARAQTLPDAEPAPPVADGSVTTPGDASSAPDSFSLPPEPDAGLDARLDQDVGAPPGPFDAATQLPAPDVGAGCTCTAARGSARAGASGGATFAEALPFGALATAWALRASAKRPSRRSRLRP